MVDMYTKILGCFKYIGLPSLKQKQSNEKMFKRNIAIQNVTQHIERYQLSED